MKHNPEIWLQAADDAVESFLSQSAFGGMGNDRGYTPVCVLSSLEALADAVYYLNYPLFRFIKSRAEHWRRYGMAHQPPKFLKEWQRHNTPAPSMKIVI